MNSDSILVHICLTLHPIAMAHSWRDASRLVRDQRHITPHHSLHTNLEFNFSDKWIKNLSPGVKIVNDVICS